MHGEMQMRAPRERGNLSRFSYDLSKCYQMTEPLRGAFLLFSLNWHRFFKEVYFFCFFWLIMSSSIAHTSHVGRYVCRCLCMTIRRHFSHSAWHLTRARRHTSYRTLRCGSQSLNHRTYSSWLSSLWLLLLLLERVRIKRIVAVI